MHEMGVTMEVLRAVADASAAAGATRVNSVTLTIGELADIVPDSLRFAWDALTPGTVAEGAELKIIEMAGRSVCLLCGEKFAHGKFDRRCTACESFATQVMSGNEMMIDHIDVDVDDD